MTSKVILTENDFKSHFKRLRDLRPKIMKIEFYVQNLILWVQGENFYILPQYREKFK